MGHFSRLVTNLTLEVVGSDQIEWEIAALRAGSAVATVRGSGPDSESIARVVGAYESVGRSLSQNLPIGFSEEVVVPATSITHVINGYVKSVAFATESATYQVAEQVDVDKEAARSLFSWGVVTGAAKTIWQFDKHLRLGVYDSLFERIVYCYLDSELEEDAREAWGKNVSVTGLIRRDEESGRPIEVRSVVKVDLAKESVPGSFDSALGVFSWDIGDEPAEETIKRIRNDYW